MSARGRGGRGIGGRRGRGSGRRNPSRGRGRGRGGSPSPRVDSEQSVSEPSMDNVKSYFMGNVSFDQHYKAQEENRDKYAAGIASMIENGVDIVQNARVRALAAGWARKDHSLANALLSVRSHYTFAEVLKALTLLDSGRSARVVEKKLKRLQCSNTKVSNKKLGKLKSEHDNLLALKPSVGSATGSVLKHVKDWVRSFSKEELEFFALHFPTEAWKKLADICHFNPEKDFSVLPWFLRFCYGDKAPEDSIVYSCKDLTAENVNELVQSHPIPFTHIKGWIKHLTDESKKIIALREKIDTLLWYYEDISCPIFDQVLAERLENSCESVTLAKGKLLERLLTFKMAREGIPQNKDQIYYDWDWDAKPDGPGKLEYKFDELKAPFLKYLIEHADDGINKISLPLESPVVIMGDASSSMEVAIKTSVIIAGILTKITSAKLVFFDDKSRDAPYLPDNVEQVLKLALSTEADNCTSPAAALLPFYRSKEIVKTFIVVTDEEENEECEGFLFTDLFDKYYKEVYPSKIVFVSFLSQHCEGQMVSSLRKEGYKPVQFKFDASKPDLTKLDHLIALLSLETSDFSDHVTTIEQTIKLQGVHSVFSKLNKI